ncbi:GntR family transcriptional regulator [Actinoplanes sp. NPDC048796]|uniref:GntR family transcriptional regulator n=1 Tax=unclassified Actinoplanes TaxID=2626549 RepID=UPI0033EF5EF9
MTDRLSFLAAPLARDAGVPLRVQVHSRILDGIRTGVLTPGSMIPTETEIGRLLGVSRTVVREALMLLDEDGFIVSRRGIGRFVADAVPEAGLERLRPLEDLLSVPGSVLELRRTQAELQETTSTYIAEELSIPADSAAWFFETVVRRDGQPIALSQEHLPADAPLDSLSPGETALSALLDRLGSGVVRFTAGLLGESRAAPLDADPGEPVLIVTQTAKMDGRPIYLAKHMLRAGAGQLSVRQPGQ